MPFSTDEINHLRDDGKLTEAQIRFLETAQVNYDKIKVLQDNEKRFATLDRQDLPLGDINVRMIYNIRPFVRDGIIPEDALDRYIAQQLEDIEEIESLNQDGSIEDYDTETGTETGTDTSSSIGGRRRRMRTRVKRSKRKRTRRRRGKKSRRMRRSR